MRDHDVLIAGGGPAGGVLALALRESGLRIAVLDARPAGAVSEDPRPLALSQASRLILERLDLWQALAPVTAIERIHVSQRGGFGRVELTAAAAGLPALGYVIDYTRLAGLVAQSLQGGFRAYLAGATVTRVDAEGDAAVIEIKVGEEARRLVAGLLVVADGGMQGDGSEG